MPRRGCTNTRRRNQIPPIVIFSRMDLLRLNFFLEYPYVQYAHAYETTLGLMNIFLQYRVLHP